MTEYCELCDEDMTGLIEGYITKNDIYISVCSRCRDRLEENEGIDGEIVEKKCPECGHRKELEWVAYETDDEKGSIPENQRTLF